MMLFEKNDMPTTISISATGINGATVVYNGKKTDPVISIAGINENYMKVNALDLATGRAFSANEFLYGENVCIVGNEVIKGFSMEGNHQHLIE